MSFPAKLRSITGDTTLTPLDITKQLESALSDDLTRTNFTNWVETYPNVIKHPALNYLYNQAIILNDTSMWKWVDKCTNYFQKVQPYDYITVNQLEHLLDSLQKIQACALFDAGLIPDVTLEKLAITHLNLDHLNLSKIPNLITKLSSLSHLSLADNPITDFSGLDKLTELHSLDLGYCDISALPNQLSSLKNMTYLNVERNPELTVLPPALFAMTSLVSINLSSTGIDQFPELVSTEHILHLNLSYTTFPIIPPEITKASFFFQLQTLELGGIEMGQEEPIWLENFTNLVTLSLYSKFYGTVPSILEKLLLLENLTISFDKLKEYPPNLLLPVLKTLKLSPLIATVSSNILESTTLEDVDCVFFQSPKRITLKIMTKRNRIRKTTLINILTISTAALFNIKN